MFYLFISLLFITALNFVAVNFALEVLLYLEHLRTRISLWLVGFFLIKKKIKKKAEQSNANQSQQA